MPKCVYIRFQIHFPLVAKFYYLCWNYRRLSFYTEPLVEGVIVIKSKKQALQIIDTTLLKCYIKEIWPPYSLLES
jgi:hypothetical protein